jgi:hypothetical protein
VCACVGPCASIVLLRGVTNLRSLPPPSPPPPCSTYATVIQRVYRGHMARKRARDAIAAHRQSLRLHFLAYCMVQWQRLLRGYLSRKYRHSYYQRKRYLQVRTLTR